MSTHGDVRAQLEESFRAWSALLYGGIGLGKTSGAFGMTGPFGHWIVTNRGALDVLQNPAVNPKRVAPAGVSVCLSTTTPCDEVHRAIDSEIEPAIREGRVGAVIIDEFSSLIKRETHKVKHIDRIDSEWGRQSDAVIERAQQVVWRLQQLGVVVIAIAHERPPVSIIDKKTNTKKFTPGGPNFPGKYVVEGPAMFSIVARLTVGRDSEGERKVMIGADRLDTNWVTKDRIGVLEGVRIPFEPRVLLQQITARAKLFNEPL